MNRMSEMMVAVGTTSTKIIAETDVAEPVAPAETPAETAKPEEKEDIDDIEKRARKPPSDGPCKGCGQSKPINRLMLCYKCWVHKNIADWAKANNQDFIPTVDAHPFWCKCTLPDHGGKGATGASN